MSEQSGGGPITREQVERARDGAKRGSLQAVADAMGGSCWVAGAPEDVRAGWFGTGTGWDDGQQARLVAALTRWRDELAAAEPVRRVARWDADLEAYTLTPTHDDGALMTHAVEDAAKARAWGYTIEGGPEPKPAEDSPERLRERRESLGWTTAYAGHWVAWFDHTDVERAESGKGVPAFVARYAAALSAEEARLAEEERLACAYRESDGTLVWDDSPLPEPERPAPRFKVGDGVRVTKGPDKPHMTPAFRKAIVEMRTGGASLSEVADAYRLGIGEVSEALDAESMAPEPAPEVVDVPQPRQPIVKRCGGVAASWQPDGTCLFIDGGAASVHAPIALLRAMLAAIDAQQGGAS